MIYARDGIKFFTGLFSVRKEMNANVTISFGVGAMAYEESILDITRIYVEEIAKLWKAE